MRAVLNNGNPKLYLELANIISQDISDGKYISGERLAPVRKLGEQYGVSNRTAAKAVQELIDSGILKSILRKGTFVSTVPAQPDINSTVPLSRVVLVCMRGVKARPNAFVQGISEEIFRLANRDGLLFSSEFCTKHSLHQVITLPFKPKPGDGAIIISGDPTLDMMALIGLDNLRTVLVDSIFPQTTTVLNDNHSGMRQILLHLKKLGHRKVALAWGEITKPNIVNENERREAFLRVSSELGLSAEEVIRQSPEEFVDYCQQSAAPTALVFTRDDPALEFIDAATAQGLKIPEQLSVTGFDDYSTHNKDLSRLTTVHVDRKAMGKIAYESLKNAQAGSGFVWERVPCSVVERGSTAKI